MLNDSFAVTRLHLSIDGDRDRFREILDVYASRDVKRLILVCDFNDGESFRCISTADARYQISYLKYPHTLTFTYTSFPL